MNKLKLISLHIHKTAGTSFFNTLQAGFGQNEVANFNINFKQQKVLLNNQPYISNQLPNDFQVLHGHFKIKGLVNLFPDSINYPIITWLRDPVERVWSHYNYLLNVFRDTCTNYEKDKEIIDALTKTIEEYVCIDTSRNKMSRYLEGMPLNKLAFVGIVEHYEEDLNNLSNLIDIPLKKYFVNKTAEKSTDIPDNIRNLIIQNNLEDMALYQEALSLRKQRKN